MRIALLSDIHANRQAFDAVRVAVADMGADRIVLLGDLVGYGADPVAVVETAAGMVEDGALAVLGNHDEAMFAPQSGLTEMARHSLDWTRGQLGADHVAFLRTLPLTARDADRLYVHASAAQPERWPYLDDADDAASALASDAARTILCGHTHRPAIYQALAGRSPVLFRPPDNRPVPLSPLRRHAVVVGSVGQPRDRNPAACFGLLDTAEACFTMVRVAYDVEEAMRRIRAAGQPEWLAMRLAIGA